MLPPGGSGTIQRTDEIRRVAEIGILQPRKRLARDRALGETLEDEVIDRAPFGEVTGGLEAIVRETRPGSDAHGRSAALHHAVLN